MKLITISFDFEDYKSLPEDFKYGLSDRIEVPEIPVNGDTIILDDIPFKVNGRTFVEGDIIFNLVVDLFEITGIDEIGDTVDEEVDEVDEELKELLQKRLEDLDQNSYKGFKDIGEFFDRFFENLDRIEETFDEPEFKEDEEKGEVSLKCDICGGDFPVSEIFHASLIIDGELNPHTHICPQCMYLNGIQIQSINNVFG